MKRLTLLALLFACTQLSFAATGDTTRVVVMDKYYWNVGQPTRKDTMTQFPDASKTYEKILMRYTLTCPTGGCGEWDYTTNVQIQVDSSWYEIGRYITPYGKGFPKDWKRTWTMDVTDFAYLLRDSVNVRSLYDGWTPGSLYTLEFDFIEGIPARTTTRVEPIYSGYFTYGNASDPIDDHVVAKKLYRGAADELVTMRLTVSGHGSDPSGACEFIDKTHSIAINGQAKYSQHLWRDDCGLNPTYPQTGTYWFPRGGWCPGDIVFPFDYDVTPFAAKNDSFTVDYNFEDYESTNPSGGYNVQGFVFFATGPNHENDAAAEDIVQPTSDYRYLRQNPICNTMDPIVVIRNNGKTPLTFCKIGYWVDDLPMNEFYWEGNLAFMEKAQVTLPNIDLGLTGTHTFSFKVFYTNGANDDYDNNDVATTTYTLPKSYSNKIVMSLKTDDCAIDNMIRWELLDGESGLAIDQGYGYENGEQVRDTFLLTTGCYRFNIYDDGLGDGLRPWVYQNNGGFTAGSYSLRDDKNVTIVSVAGSSNAANFGFRNTTTFNVGTPSSVEEKQVALFSVYPNPASASVSLDLSAFGNETVTFMVYDVLGKAVLYGDGATLDVSSLGAGSYIVRAESETMRASARLVIER